MQPPIFARFFCLLALLAPLAGVSSESARSLSDQEWIDDLRQMEAAIRKTHFKPFHVVQEADFNTAVARLESDIPGLSDAEVIISMAAIVASLRDGHTRLHLPRLYPELALVAELGHSGTPAPRFEALKLQQLPVRFEVFEDGVFVVGATAQHRDLIGSAVLRIDDTSIDDALRRVRSVCFFENDSRALLMAPDRLALPQVTTALGVSHSSEQLRLTTRDRDGREATTVLRSLKEPGQQFFGGIPNPPPLWQSQMNAYRWYQILGDRDAIYVQVNQFEQSPQTPYGDFVADTLGAARAAGVSRFIVDLRHNSGGIGAWVTPFVTGIGRSEYNEYGRLYLLVGRNTFSAAQHFMHRFEEYTYAIFAGEPSGARPSHFSDPKRIVLDNSGLTLRVSTLYWHSWLANDFRDAINPHVSAAVGSADYFGGFDPVLNAALDYVPPRGLARQIEEQFRQGKNQNALLLYNRYMSDGTISDHRAVVPDLLSMADKLVKDGLLKPGYFVYFLVNASYPGDVRIAAELDRLKALLN